MSALDQLSQAFKTILEEASRRPEFAERLAQALNAAEAQGAASPAARATKGSAGRGRNRRAPPVLDPLQLYSDGEERLRDGLAGLSIEQLKDIVAEHGMDTRRLAMRWKRRDRLEELIVTTVRARLTKGSAFREDPTEG
jgi:hypothetical protein